MILCLAALPRQALAVCATATMGPQPERKVFYNLDYGVLQYCNGTSWVPMGPKPGGPTGCPNIGDLCSAGSYYAGLSPDGNVAMYMAAAGSETTATWNNGTSNWTVTGFTSTDDGDGNTAGLVALSDAGAPYDAAVYCDSLDAHGYQDWYLPSTNESDLIHNGGSPIGDILADGTWYWTSREGANNLAQRQRFNIGDILNSSKDNTSSVRCVRREGTELTSVVPAGLVGHWKLDETSGTTAIDYASSNDGTMQGGLDAGSDSVPGKVGTALDFDGDNDYIEIASNTAIGLDSSGEATFSAWIYPRSLGQNDQGRIIDKSGASAVGSGYTLRHSSPNRVDVGINGGAGVGVAESPSNVVTLNRWQHVAGVYDGAADNVDFYIDGVYVGSDSVDGNATIVGNTDPVRIGMRSTDLNRDYDGFMDDVRIYDRALSADEIKQLYDARTANIVYDADIATPKFFNGSEWMPMGRLPSPGGDSVTDGLVGHWKLDETSGSNIDDTTANNNDGVWYDSANNDVTEEASGGKAGGALDFDGTDDAIDLGDVLELPLPVSVSMWVNHNTGALSDWEGLFSTNKENTGGANAHSGIWVHALSSGVVEANFGSGAGCGPASRQTKEGTTVLSAGTWHHIVAVIRGANDMDIYFDGADDGGSYSGTGGALAYNAGYNASIGRTYDCGTSTDHVFNGLIDDVRIYDRALSAAEVAVIYKGLPSTLRTGLIAYWPLDEAAGSTTATDMAGGHDGTESGGVLFGSAGQIGAAAEFDGVDDAIIGPAPLPQNGTFTATAWFKRAGAAGGSSNAYHTILENILGDFHRPRILVASDGTFILLQQYDGLSTQINCTFVGAPFGDNSWHHITYVFDGAEIRGYIDGSSAGAPCASNGVQTGSSSWRIGWYDSDTYIANGSIDDVRVYHRALSDAEIDDIYQAGLLGLPPATCANPTRTEGKIIYNDNANAMQFCDGAAWQRIGP